jgi:dethiobiotin synthetase
VRPSAVIVVTGTGTEIGKTWVASAVAVEARRRGWSVAARKPLQSYDAGDHETDADRLAVASGEDSVVVCPPERSYPLPLAPPMAAEALGRSVPSVQDVARALVESWPGRRDLGVVEGAGGVASPLAADGDTAALARAVSADGVVLVADPSLGVISSVRLAMQALTGISTVVYLNRFDGTNDLHDRNRTWLVERDRFTVITSPSSLLEWVAGLAAGGTQCRHAQGPAR